MDADGQAPAPDFGYVGDYKQSLTARPPRPQKTMADIVKTRQELARSSARPER